MLIPTLNPDKKLFIHNTVLLGMMVLIILAVPLSISVKNIQAEKQERQVCKNFKTQREAKVFRDRLMGVPGMEKLVKDLDRNGDGEVCESLPK